MRIASAYPGHRMQHLAERRRALLAGIFRLVDPKIALASVVPFVVGLALAFDARGDVRWGWAGAAFLTIFLVEVGKNAVNDYCDFETDADVRPEERSPFSGGKRVLVDQLMTKADLVVVAFGAFGLAALIGTGLAIRTRPSLLLLGAAAAAISILYTAPPVRLSSRGLGEAAVFAVYGPGIVLGTLLLFGVPLTWEALIASISLGLLIANVLVINEIPDERADRQAGKRTLVVRLGRDRTESLMASLFVFAFAFPIAAAMYGIVPFRIAAFLAGVPVAAVAISLLRRTRTGPPVNAQAATLATYVVTGAAVAAAVLLL